MTRENTRIPRSWNAPSKQ